MAKQVHSWQGDLLRSVGAPVTTNNVMFLNAWQQAEGGGQSGPSRTAYNWLNTTQSAPGAVAINSVGVKSYPNYQTGINALSKTLTNGYYNPIVSALRLGNTSPQQLASLVAKSPWGTGGGVLRVLKAGPVGEGITPSSTSSMILPDSIGGGLINDASNKLNIIGSIMKSNEDFIGGKTTDTTSTLSGILAFAQQQAAQLQQKPYDGYTSNASPVTPFAGSTGLPLSGNRVNFIQEAMKKARTMGLRVGENSLYDPVDPVHVSGSYHYQQFPNTNIGRAADISGNPQAMSNFYAWAQSRYGKSLTELFYDPLGGIKNGQQIGAIGNHMDHVHIAF